MRSSTSVNESLSISWSVDLSCESRTRDEGCPEFRSGCRPDLGTNHREATGRRAVISVGAQTKTAILEDVRSIRRFFREARKPS